MNKKTLGAVAVGALLLVGAGCAKTPVAENTAAEAPNAKMAAGAEVIQKEQLVGSWKAVVASFDEITLNADGTFTTMYNGKPLSPGVWSVEGTTLRLKDDTNYIVNAEIVDAKVVDGKLTGKNVTTEQEEEWDKK